MESRPGLVIALVSSLIAIGQLSTSIYMPSMPAMTVELDTTAAILQLTLTVYLAGFAISQLVLGPLSDRYGRRPVMLIGLGLYVLASIACAVAPSVEALIAARFAQSIGACTGSVVGRAVIRDLYDGEEAARVMAYVGLVLGVSPAFAPAIGAYLHVWFGWPANFLFIAVVGTAIGMWSFRALTETNRFVGVRPSAFAGMASSYLRLIRSPAFVGYTVNSGFVFGGLFAYMSESPFIFVEMLGYPETVYGWFALLGVGAYALSSLMAGRFSHRLRIDAAVVAGTAISLIGGVAMAAFALSGVFNAVVILGPIMVVAVGIGLVFPYATAGALSAFPEIAGTASALLGFAQMAMAALATMTVGLLRDGTQVPLTLIVAGFMVAACLTLLILLIERRRAFA